MKHLVSCSDRACSCQYQVGHSTHPRAHPRQAGRALRPYGENPLPGAVGLREGVVHDVLTDSILLWTQPAGAGSLPQARDADWRR